MIDLHCHSIFSDGALSPEELIQRAQTQHLTCFSLTDHDTVAAYSRLQQAALNSGITLINGIELSVRWKKYDIHVLGYQINHTEDLLALIERQNQSRVLRAEQIGASLETLGIEKAYSKACEIAGHKRVGRPHFAQVIINEGKSRDMKAAFKQFLIRGRKGYIPTPWVSIQEAVTVIKQAGGQAVIAHPLKYGLTRTKLHELISEFKEVGGCGLEVVSGNMTATEINQVAGMSLRFDLLASSGSDFHSDTASRTKLGGQSQLPEMCKPIWYNWTI
ncbi:PHP domain-containing protein [Legionella sp. km772]|uniref:PHP domain-containing protein n=1 Tax=Legionella sp. km772 TaxID=2498111 RepID=UPI000F8E9801|nr:PHP domain-containing protein [Legionella sp. km772]RUR12303.1 PHP domain-containing protein [Legionella sp. km772]